MRQYVFILPFQMPSSANVKQHENTEKTVSVLLKDLFISFVYQLNKPSQLPQVTARVKTD